MTLIALLAAATLAPATPAAQAFARGDFASAQTAYRRALTRSPRNLDALLGMAQIELYGNDLRDAARDARAALSVRPGNTQAQSILAGVAERERVLHTSGAARVPAAGVVIPFLQRDPLPVINVRVDGEPAAMILDTGAPDVTLDPVFVKRLGLKAAPGRRGVFLGGRSAPVGTTLVPRIDAGTLELRDVNASVLPSFGMRLRDGRPIAGVLGTAFLSRFLSTIDYPHSRLILRPRSAAPPQEADATAVPMWLVGDHFIFARGRVNGLDGLFSVDSGGAGVGFAPTAATVKTAQIQTFPKKAAQAMGGGGPVRVIPTLAKQVCLASACQRNVAGVYTPDGDPLSTFPFNVAGTVSHEFLKQYAVTFDFARMHIVLIPAQQRTLPASGNYGGKV